MINFRMILACLILMTSVVCALEKKPIDAIDTDQLTDETQLAVSCGDDHMNFIWWIPPEYWRATFLSDDTISEADKKQLMNTLRPYSFVMVCQADISSLGSFRFYSKNEIANNLEITLKSKDGKLTKFKPLQVIPQDLKLFIDMSKPILTNAMGNMGENMYFFVLSDLNLKGKRKIDPYKYGILNFSIGKRTGELMQTQLAFPLNSLYVPRKCPNGKNAHVSWKYCPWTGAKLDD